MYSRIDFTLPIQRLRMVEHGVPLNQNYLHIDSSGYKVGGKIPLSSSSANLIHFNSLFSTPSFLPFRLPPSVNIKWRKIKQRKDNPRTRQVPSDYLRHASHPRQHCDLLRLSSYPNVHLEWRVGSLSRQFGPTNNDQFCFKSEPSSTIQCLTLSDVYYSYSTRRSQKNALFRNFISVKNSKCFGQTYCPSSGFLILYSQQQVFVILCMLTEST